MQKRKYRLAYANMRMGMNKKYIYKKPSKSKKLNVERIPWGYMDF